MWRTRHTVYVALVFTLAGLVLVWYQYWQRSVPYVQPPLREDGLSIVDITVPSSTESDATSQAEPATLSETPVVEAPVILGGKVVTILQDVPFISQAPFGEWDNLVFQDGCEEASMIMSMAWVQGTTLTPESGKQAIESITQFETKKFGVFMSDTSTADTAQVMQEYYAYKNISVARDISMEDIKILLGQGALVMAPMNGQLLHNPNFTQPGPLHHMLVIIGYDAEMHEFVTNDPGTKQGAEYRYNEDTLYQALRDYPTSNDEQPITDIHKTVIVIKK